MVKSAVIEPDGALMTMAEVVAEDAVKGGETGSGTGEEDGLVKIARGVEAVAGGALEGNGVLSSASASQLLMAPPGTRRTWSWRS